MNYPPRNQGQQNGMFAAVNNAAASVANAASGAVEAVVNTAANTVQNIGQGVNQFANAAVNVASNVAANANAAVNAMPNAINSLIPFANNIAAGANNRRANNATVGVTGNGLINDAVNNGFLNAVNSAVASANANTSGPFSFLQGTLGIFIGLFTLFLIIFAVFNEQIRSGYEYMIVYLRDILGLETRPDVVSQITPIEGDVTSVPPSPGDVGKMPLEMSGGAAGKLVEKILLTPGSSEVYNVAQNKYTYYDAEPLCKALGAELATYDQVREAWAKGADWCNYGWVKGQMAVFPTQKPTYDKLQNGPAEEKRACGTVGVNGGVFDNPELRFGVNCVGPKPSQTNHDERSLMEQGKVPRGPETLAVDRKIAAFKEEADSTFIRPFNSEKWSS